MRSAPIVESCVTEAMRRSPMGPETALALPSNGPKSGADSLSELGVPSGWEAAAATLRACETGRIGAATDACAESATRHEAAAAWRWLRVANIAPSLVAPGLAPPPPMGGLPRRDNSILHPEHIRCQARGCQMPTRSWPRSRPRGAPTRAQTAPEARLSGDTIATLRAWRAG